MGRKKKSEEDESEFITIADARASMRRGSTTRKKSHRIFSDATLDKLKDAQREISARTRLDREGAFLKQSRAVHGDKFDYSKVEYVDGKTKVTIICPDHGEFQQRPQDHLNGHGCPKCSRQGLSREERIEKFREVHGERYDYSKVVYEHSQTKVTIICPDHGEFELTPNGHQSGQGCPECRKQSRLREKILKKTPQIIAKFKDVHGDRYDYSKVEYVNSKTPVTIICPEHGQFEKGINSHIAGQGCPKCREPITRQKQSMSAKRRHKNDPSHLQKLKEEQTLKLSEVLERFRKKHGDRYDYSKVEYVNNKTPVTIICREHGEFQQQIGNHIRGNCPKCVGVAKPTTEEIVEKFREVHGDRYDYSKVEYVNESTKVIIICRKHGEFEVRPRKHISNVEKLGCHCPDCVQEEKVAEKTEKMIERFRATHGDRYDYSKVNYQGSGTKVTIICREHGEFFLPFKRHWNGAHCQECSKLISAEKRRGRKTSPKTKERIRQAALGRKSSRLLSQDQVIKNFRQVHGDRYDYSKVNYQGSGTKVTIICPDHGEFEQRAGSHRRGIGCRKCYDQRRRKT